MNEYILHSKTLLYLSIVNSFNNEGKKVLIGCLLLGTLSHLNTLYNNIIYIKFISYLPLVLQGQIFCLNDDDIRQARKMYIFLNEKHSSFCVKYINYNYYECMYV